MFKFKSQLLRVVSQKRDSKARYVKGIDIGDEIQLIQRSTGDRREKGYTASYYTINVNGESYVNISQGELNNLVDIFELKELGIY